MKEETPNEYDKILADLQSVIKTNEGKSVIWHLLSQCGLYLDPFTGDRAKTDYLLGQRSIGLMILGLLQDTSPTLYAELQLWSLNNGIE